MRERQTARLIVLDPLDRVLLFRVALSTSDAFWITPGGKLHSGESYEDAALRELREETGFDDLALGPWIWDQDHVLAGKAGPVRFRERYYLVRTELANRAIRYERRTTVEAAVLVADRWWTIPELHATREIVYPLRLATLLEPIVQGRFLGTPLRI